MTALEKLGAFVANHIPNEPACADARLHAADAVGAWIAASATKEGKLLRGFRQPGASLPDHVAINCALVRLSEIDDIHLGSMVTPGAIVVPAALTIAAALPDLEENELAAAIIAGYEAMIRLGAAIDGPSVLYRGIWPTYFAAPFGVAATAARLMRLSTEQTANALSLALIAASPGTGHHAATTTARWLAAGYAASRGLQAALAAGAGFTSDLKIADGDFLKNIYNVAPNADLIANGWDKPALSDTSFKPWCAARQTMAATQALKELMAEGVTVDSIVRIGVAVLPPHLKMIDHGVSMGDRFSFLTSVQYQLAVAAISPDAAYGLSAPNGPTPPDLLFFMERIKVRAEDSLLTAGYPQAWPAHVTVTTRAKRHDRGVIHVPGDPARRWDEDALKAKFLAVMKPALKEEPAEPVFELALRGINDPAAVVAEIERLAAL
ncbi:MmgE/PrpD family protein [Rhodoplanes sp. Z2-YC6860]|uniref:MmgE/PrpD family protein n=1 Tax=Rhodoplanes sp. Z2-YC6860 TaxID=674703 RepID=UPI00078E9A70|nr:MmgE/PrpD family protein [Rhodoplanes sp. Z2-YC6860]AMN43020.1 2-methylcitrate dehydratase family protein [Rhodoplanes sp. Z2-YC6860]